MVNGVCSLVAVTSLSLPSVLRGQPGRCPAAPHGCEEGAAICPLCVLQANARLKSEDPPWEQYLIFSLCLVQLNSLLSSLDADFSDHTDL